MSRSRRHFPIIGMASNGRGTMKKFRRRAHKAARTDLHIKLLPHQYNVTNNTLIGDKYNTNPQIVLPEQDNLIDCKWFYDEWSSPRDGKQWLTCDDRDEWMRK